MAAAVLDVPAASPVPASQPAPAAARFVARLVLRAVLGSVVLALLAMVVGPRLYPFQTFYVRSASMAPGIPVGALVVATRASADVLDVGEVIVFERPGVAGMMVVHRIDAVEATPEGRAFVTRGDANAAPDAWRVPATGDGWQARYSISRAGFVVGWLHAALSRRGWLGALSLAVAAHALVLIWRSEDTE